MQLVSALRQWLARFTPKQLYMAAGASFVLLIALIGFAIPSLLRSRAQAALEARTGLKVSIDSVSLAGGGASPRGVHLTSSEPGVDISIESVDTKFSWTQAPFAGTKALTAVQATGVDAELDIASSAFSKLKEQLR